MISVLWRHKEPTQIYDSKKKAKERDLSLTLIKLIILTKIAKFNNHHLWAGQYDNYILQIVHFKVNFMGYYS